MQVALSTETRRENAMKMNFINYFFPKLFFSYFSKISEGKSTKPIWLHSNLFVAPEVWSYWYFDT